MRHSDRCTGIRSDLDPPFKHSASLRRVAVAGVGQVGVEPQRGEAGVEPALGDQFPVSPASTCAARKSL